MRESEWDESQENRYSIITEVIRTENPEAVYEIHYGPYDTENFVQIYRAERMPLYPEKLDIQKTFRLIE